VGEDGAVIPSELVDPSTIEVSLRPFGRSRMLPAAVYTRPEILAWEREHFFAGTWTCIGRRPETGQRAYAVGNLSVLVTVTRGAALAGTGSAGSGPSTGTVRAFANVCRHRGHELLPVGAESDRRAIVCPYHGWAYRPDGALATAPAMPPDFDGSEWGLVPLPVVDWHGWIFVNPGPAAPPFDEFIGELDEWVAPYRPEALHVAATHHYEVAANWKLICENYHECYHCTMIHPELCTVTSPTSGRNGTGPGAWIGGTMDLLPHATTMSLDGSSALPPLHGVNPRTVTYVGLFPNLLMSLHPDYVMTHRLVPLAPGRTFVECQWMFAAPDADPAYAVEFWDRTNLQDWAAVESVQRGLASPHHRSGPLAPTEGAIYDWVTMLARGYRDRATIPRAPGYVRTWTGAQAAEPGPPVRTA
jgi:Rieske 2Fe-2S family protein